MGPTDDLMEVATDVTTGYVHDQDVDIGFEFDTMPPLTEDENMAEDEYFIEEIMEEAQDEQAAIDDEMAYEEPEQEDEEIVDALEDYGSVHEDTVLLDDQSGALTDNAIIASPSLFSKPYDALGESQHASNYFPTLSAPQASYGASMMHESSAQYQPSSGDLTISEDHVMRSRGPSVEAPNPGPAHDSHTRARPEVPHGASLGLPEISEEGKSMEGHVNHEPHTLEDEGTIAGSKDDFFEDFDDAEDEVTLEVTEDEEQRDVLQASESVQSAQAAATIGGETSLPPPSYDTEETHLTAVHNLEGAADVGETTSPAHEEIKASTTHLYQKNEFRTYPIIVHYQDNQISLFPPTDGEEQSETFFLSDETLAGGNIREVLEACRSVLAESINEADELQLVIPTLNLLILESAEYAVSTTLSAITDLYLELQFNEGIDRPGPLEVEFRHVPSFSSRMNQLRAAAASGKGFSEIISQPMLVPQGSTDLEYHQDPETPQDLDHSHQENNIQVHDDVVVAITETSKDHIAQDLPDTPRPHEADDFDTTQGKLGVDFANHLSSSQASATTEVAQNAFGANNRRAMHYPSTDLLKTDQEHPRNDPDNLEETLPEAIEKVEQGSPDVLTLQSTVVDMSKGPRSYSKSNKVNATHFEAVDELQDFGTRSIDQDVSADSSTLHGDEFDHLSDEDELSDLKANVQELDHSLDDNNLGLGKSNHIDNDPARADVLKANESNPQGPLEDDRKPNDEKDLMLLSMDAAGPGNAHQNPSPTTHETEQLPINALETATKSMTKPDDGEPSYDSDEITFEDDEDEPAEEPESSHSQSVIGHTTSHDEQHTTIDSLKRQRPAEDQELDFEDPQDHDVKRSRAD